jgi:hypothetical protein
MQNKQLRRAKNNIEHEEGQTHIFNIYYLYSVSQSRYY